MTRAEMALPMQIAALAVEHGPGAGLERCHFRPLPRLRWDQPLIEPARRG
jgi:hypothetical protein